MRENFKNSGYEDDIMRKELLHTFNFIPKALQSFLNIIQFHVLNYYKDKKNIQMIKNVFKETDCQLKANEAFLIYSLARAKSRSHGDFAEVGVYQGSSAKIICEIKGEKHLHLFDTFEGLPEVGKIDNLFRKKQYKASLEEVQHYLSKYHHVSLYKGIFPATANDIKEKTFSFVHMDVDIYNSTAACLNFFYPRMEKGGIILSHDYAQAAGVKRAFQEFFQDKPESIIELAESQCMVIKT